MTILESAIEEYFVSIVELRSVFILNISRTFGRCAVSDHFFLRVIEPADSLVENIVVGLLPSVATVRR